MKRCPKCKQDKNASEYYKRAASKDGLQTYCKPCAKTSVVETRPNAASQTPEARRTWRHANIASGMLSASKKRAKKAGVPHSITLEDIVIPEVCPVLDIPLYPGIGRGPQANAPSLDRIKPELGYVPGNIQVMSHLANSMKRNATSAQLRKFAEWVMKEVVDG